MAVVDLPIFVNGEAIELGGGAEAVVFEYDSGLTIRMPRFTEQHLQRIAAEAPRLHERLCSLSTFEVTDFLSQLGKTWMDGSAPSYKLARELVPRVTGYPDAMIASDMFLVAEYLRYRTYAYEQILAELGHEYILDDWIPVQASYQRAFPIGSVVHFLVGNLPLASLYSLIRGTITRNRNLGKLASRDPVSACAFAMGLNEVDPRHPIAQSLSLGYWPHADALSRLALERANATVLWGGRTAVEELKALVPAGVNVVEFGPRWSAAVIDLDSGDYERAAFRLASDMCFYDQEACFSTQRAFVKGDIDAFLPHLYTALDRFAKRMPLVTPNRDVLAHRTAARLEGMVRHWDVRRGGDDAWVVAVVKDPTEVVEHPLGRTLYMHPISDMGGIARYLGKSFQTLTCFPWSATEAYRDTWARAGAERIVELGMSRHVRHGYTHDGQRALNGLVRMVSLERPMGGRHFYKYGDCNLDMSERAIFVVD